MNRTEAYMELLEAIQNYVQAIHTEKHYARDWVLITGIEPLNGPSSDSQVRLDSSPNASTWSIYGLLTMGIDNFQTREADDDED